VDVKIAKYEQTECENDEHLKMKLIAEKVRPRLQYQRYYNQDYYTYYFELIFS